MFHRFFQSQVGAREVVSVKLDGHLKIGHHVVYIIFDLLFVVLYLISTHLNFYNLCSLPLRPQLYFSLKQFDLRHFEDLKKIDV